MRILQNNMFGLGGLLVLLSLSFSYGALVLFSPHIDGGMVTVNLFGRIAFVLTVLSGLFVIAGLFVDQRKIYALLGLFLAFVLVVLLGNMAFGI